MTMSDTNPTEQEIAETLERGGPWITIRFVSEGGDFEQLRRMSLPEAEQFIKDLTAEIENAKTIYQVQEN
jgi:pyruvate kinase